MATLIDSNPTSNYTSYGWAYNTSVSTWCISFTGQAGNLASAKFYLGTNATPASGTCRAKLYAHSGTFGTSSVPNAAALATSDNVDVTLATSPALVEFTFTGDNQYTMSDSTYYIIGVETVTTFLQAHALGVGLDNTPSFAGNSSYYYNSAWTVYTDSDLIFYVYTADAPAGPANLKTYNGLAKASNKTVNGLAIASVKTFNGLT
jgi:hypothetical protein